MAEPRRNISEEEELELLRLKKLRAQSATNGVGVFPAQPAKPRNPGARTGEVLQSADSFIGQTQD